MSVRSSRITHSKQIKLLFMLKIIKFPIRKKKAKNSTKNEYEN